MKINTKLMLISGCGLIVIFICSLVWSVFYYDNLKNEQIKSTVFEAKQNFEVAMTAKKKVWLTNALQVANNPGVVSALTEKDRTKANQVLEQLGKVFKENTGFKNVNVHLVDENLNSFYKSWKPDSYGESLSYSDGYKLVKNTKKAYSAMEVSTKGIRLKGLFPIIDAGKFIGIANFEGGLNSIKRTLKPYDIEFLYFMDSDDVDIAKGMKDKTQLGNYILNQKDVDEDFFKYVQGNNTLDRLEKTDYHIDDQYLSFSSNFKDFKGNDTGLYVLGVKTNLVMKDIATLRNIIITLFTFLFLVFSALVVLILLFVKFQIIGPIRAVTFSMEDIATGDGDLTKRIDNKRNDEIGDLVKWVNSFIEKIQGIIVNISHNAKQVNTSSDELSAISREMSGQATETSSRADNLSAASEEMSVNLNNVAAAMEQSATNTSMVASAAEEMTATIKQISEQAENARGISKGAVEQAQSTSAKIGELGEAAKRIGQVTETITEISEQTNLLALNATIEAARAGDAGKGFAVVANEIKDLAKQTAEATLNIKNQIEDVQQATGVTVTDIEQITAIIHNVNEIVTTIASSVDEQSSATMEIADNINQASEGIQEVNENVGQSSAVANEINKDISEVNNAAGSMSKSSDSVLESAEKLSKMAGELDRIVNTFKV